MNKRALELMVADLGLANTELHHMRLQVEQMRDAMLQQQLALNAAIARTNAALERLERGE